jgi:beta-galactosidase GanA
VGQPLNVSYDGRAILINGSRTLFISGSIHYPRSTPAMWDSLMKRSIAAGVNLIQTYVFWNLHEPIKGQYYFDDYADLVQFLSVAKQNQIFVNLRIGPYVCAEWNYGGFPEWLREIPDVTFRTYNQPFMTEMQTWMTYIDNLMKK